MPMLRLRAAACINLFCLPPTRLSAPRAEKRVCLPRRRPICLRISWRITMPARLLLGLILPCFCLSRLRQKPVLPKIIKIILPLVIRPVGRSAFGWVILMLLLCRRFPALPGPVRFCTIWPSIYKKNIRRNRSRHPMELCAPRRVWIAGYWPEKIAPIRKKGYLMRLICRVFVRVNIKLFCKLLKSPLPQIRIFLK